MPMRSQPGPTLHPSARASQKSSICSGVSCLIALVEVCGGAMRASYAHGAGVIRPVSVLVVFALQHEYRHALHLALRLRACAARQHVADGRAREAGDAVDHAGAEALVVQVEADVHLGVCHLGLGVALAATSAFFRIAQFYESTQLIALGCFLLDPACRLLDHPLPPQ